MKDFIDITYWRLGHLDEVSDPSDFYYVNLARNLRDRIMSSPMGMKEEEMICEELAMTLTYYLEDIVSGFEVWNTFTSKHMELYGKILPFYSLDEKKYNRNSINKEDIAFLIWMVFQTTRSSSFINPENSCLIELSEDIYKVLKKELKKAPKNKELLKEMQQKVACKDLYELRDFISRFISSSYLLHFFSERHRLKLIQQLESFFGEGLDDDLIDYAIQASLSFTEKTGPLALYPKDWIAAILNSWGMTKDSQRIAKIEALPHSMYLLKRVYKNNLQVVDLSGKGYLIRRDSFSSLSEDSLVCKTLCASLVKYGNEWLVNGMSSWMKEEEVYRQIEEEKRFISENNKWIYEKVCEYGNGSPLLYFKNSSEFTTWLEENIGLDESFILPKDIKKIQKIAVFVDKENGLRCVPNGAYVIKDPHNPYYSKKYAEKEAFSMLASSSYFPKEMLDYLVEHNMLSDACIKSMVSVERGRELVQENLDFIVRMLAE